MTDLRSVLILFIALFPTPALAEFFEVKLKYINIIRGAKGREKTVEITGKTEEALKRVMEAIP